MLYIYTYDIFIYNNILYVIICMYICICMRYVHMYVCKFVCMYVLKLLLVIVLCSPDINGRRRVLEFATQEKFHLVFARGFGKQFFQFFQFFF